MTNYLLDIAMSSICGNTKYQLFSNKENWYDLLLNFDINFFFYLWLLITIVVITCTSFNQWKSRLSMLYKRRWLSMRKSWLYLLPVFKIGQMITLERFVISINQLINREIWIYMFTYSYLFRVIICPILKTGHSCKYSQNFLNNFTGYFR